jgi:hypothetical protein
VKSAKRPSSLFGSLSGIRLYTILLNIIRTLMRLRLADHLFWAGSDRIEDAPVKSGKRESSGS